MRTPSFPTSTWNDTPVYYCPYCGTSRFDLASMEEHVAVLHPGAVQVSEVPEPPDPPVPPAPPEDDDADVLPFPGEPTPEEEPAPVVTQEG